MAEELRLIVQCQWLETIITLLSWHLEADGNFLCKSGQCNAGVFLQVRGHSHGLIKFRRFGTEDNKFIEMNHSEKQIHGDID